MVAVLCALFPYEAPAQTAPDWNALQSEAVEMIQSYVRINTSNPPGDVTKAADFLAALLQREGALDGLAGSEPLLRRRAAQSWSPG